MSGKYFFFAGGGTGGHIYPSIGVAERILEIEPEAKIHFFCGSREIDTQVLAGTDFQYTQLPAKGFSVQPARLVGFCRSFFESYRIVNAEIAEGKNAVVLGAGGYVAAPVCWAAYRMKIPVKILNVDILPGKANKIIANWADEVFLQFEETAKYFAGKKLEVTVTGCPLRKRFEGPEPEKVREKLGLEVGKKVLVVTGASSGSERINKTICSVLGKLEGFAGGWQIVHLAGKANYEQVRGGYEGAKIGYKVLDYFDDMADLLAAADLVVGRSGAVSVAEYAAAGVPSVCVPYPYHKDRHQYLNAEKLVGAGAAVVVDDLPNARERAGWLAETLVELMGNEGKLGQMREGCREIGRVDAGRKVAERLVEALG